ncbi:hypothetical protein [Sorangium sp. So ce363]|uniref:hypothetical protein n=1 Tax=Sorangium sp. So ce363 TaxID=3133304 RepID=UPI003F5F754A
MIQKLNKFGGVIDEERRFREVWRLVHDTQELAEDERAVYEALSTPEHELVDWKSVSDSELARKLGWPARRAERAIESLVKKRIEPYL